MPTTDDTKDPSASFKPWGLESWNNDATTIIIIFSLSTLRYTGWPGLLTEKEPKPIKIALLWTQCCFVIKSAALGRFLIFRLLELVGGLTRTKNDRSKKKLSTLGLDQKITKFSQIDQNLLKFLFNFSQTGKFKGGLNPLLHRKGFCANFKNRPEKSLKSWALGPMEKGSESSKKSPNGTKLSNLVIVHIVNARND